MCDRIKNAFLKFYIKFIERYKDGQIPKGHLKLFVFNDEYKVFQREEDKRFFLLSEFFENKETYREVVIADEYPKFNIYDVTFEDIDKRCPSAPYKGKVEGKDRFVYFDLKNKKA